MIKNIIMTIKYWLWRAKQYIHSWRTHTYFDASPRNMEAVLYMISIVHNDAIQPQTPYQHWTEERLKNIYDDLCATHEKFKDEYPTYEYARKYLAYAAVEKIMQYAPVDVK